MPDGKRSVEYQIFGTRHDGIPWQGVLRQFEGNRVAIDREVEALRKRNAEAHVHFRTVTVSPWREDP